MYAEQLPEACASAADRVGSERGLADDEAVLHRVRLLERGGLKRQTAATAGIEETQSVQAAGQAQDEVEPAMGAKHREGAL